jgi:hypothetical protein
VYAIALPLAADGAGDLKAALQKLRGREPVKAVVQLGEWQRTVEDKQPHEQSAQADFQLTEGPGGFGLTVLPATADRVRAEAQKPTPKNKQERKGYRPVTDLVSSFGTTEAVELLNTSESLLKLLEGAAPKEDRQDPSQGQSGRLLGFQLPTKEESKLGAKAKTTGYFKVWLDAGGIPFASQRTQGFEAGFMWIKAKGEERVNRRYMVEGGRLVVIEETRENNVDGAGNEVRSRRTLKLTLLREPTR